MCCGAAIQNPQTPDPLDPGGPGGRLCFLQDAVILEYCRRIVARYRRGEPVSEDELEFAFAQLERRLT